MAGTIVPLPVMLEQVDQPVAEPPPTPDSLVVRYGYQKRVAELTYEGSQRPACGAKLVILTPRGIELGEMLTTTCPNAGCGKSVTRKQLLQYVEASGGKQFPFNGDGKVLRVATAEDLNEQRHLEADKPAILRTARQFIVELNLEMKLIEVEPLLGGERIVFYYITPQKWVDFRELVRKLAAEYHTRIEMCQVNDREEARLVADYEKCGQYCCCKNFLKVLKPVSMRSAKIQKATLDPKKISGRCGRLMCCLRYEDETYESLRKKLPHKKQAVETEDGIGIVLDGQILTQLVLVKIGLSPPAAYPLENLRILGKEEANTWRKQQKEEADQRAEAAAEREARREQRRRGEPTPPRSAPTPPPPSSPTPSSAKHPLPPSSEYSQEPGSQQSSTDANDSPRRKKRRRRRRRGGGGADGGAPSPGGPTPPA